MIPSPPNLPTTSSLTPEIADYLLRVDEFLKNIYSAFKNFDIGTIKISSGSGAPTGGEDGDIYIRKAAASTQLYLNINGTFSGYTNP